jgi:hypothetical protein
MCIDGGSFSFRGTIYGVFFFLFEESFMGDSGVIWTVLKLDQTVAGSKQFPDSNPIFRQTQSVRHAKC